MISYSPDVVKPGFEQELQEDWTARSQRCYNAGVADQQVQDAAIERRGLRRRWLFLMPAVFVTYSLAYLGRSNFGFGAAPDSPRRSKGLQSRMLLSIDRFREREC
jgi:hypothetical protein